MTGPDLNELRKTVKDWDEAELVKNSTICIEDFIPEMQAIILEELESRRINGKRIDEMQRVEEMNIEVENEEETEAARNLYISKWLILLAIPLIVTVFKALMDLLLN